MQWFPEVRQCVPNALFVFVGNKLDLRGSKVPAFEEFRAAVQKDAQCEYYECSALTQEGLTEVFEAAARRLIEKRTGKTMQTPPKAPRKGEKEKEESSCQMI